MRLSRLALAGALPMSLALAACGGGASTGTQAKAAEPTGPVLHVAPAGDDAAAGTAEAPLKSLDRAVARLKESGGTLKLADGNYPELIFREAAAQRITITGETAVRGRPSAKRRPVVTVDGARLGGASNLTFSGLRFTKSIQLASATGLRLERLELDGQGAGSCVRMRSGIVDFVLRDSWVHDCARGVSGYTPSSQQPSERISIVGNLIEGCYSDGIAFGGWNATTIDRNTIRRFRAPVKQIHNDGIQVFGFVDGLRISRNRISDSNGQLILLQSAIGQTKNVTIANNVLFGGAGFAVQASGQPGFKVINNTIWNKGGFSAVLLRSPPPAHPEYDFRDAVIANNILSGLALYKVKLRPGTQRGNFTLPGMRAITAPGNTVGRDPGFVDVRKGDLRLRRAARARRGASAALASSTDVTGRRRGTRSSIGAYR